jgi:hypothetical protein
VVRAAAANMNYSLLRLHQDGKELKLDFSKRRQECAFGILPGRSHSGDEMGIIRSVKMKNADKHPTAKWVLRCLQVTSADEYKALSTELEELTARTQKDEHVEEEKKLFGTKKYITSRYSMLVFRFLDDRGDTLSEYDLYITGGPHYSADDLPPGFFIDRQRNKRSSGKLTYYLDYDVLRKGLSKEKMEGRIGFRVVARPEKSDDALVFYEPIEFQSDEDAISEILRPNETLMIEIKFERKVDATVFRIEDNLTPSKISSKPRGKTVK